jgi:hypothetical protein
MANRFQNFFESIVYAGMKPGVRSPESAPAAKPGRFARFLNGPAQSDPLYLTNRTFGQKAQRMLLTVSPVIVMVAGGLAAFHYMAPKTEAAPIQLTAAELAEKTLPGFNKEIKLDVNRDVEVTEVHFEKGMMVGSLRNTTTHPIVQATVVFELADASDSQLGGVTVTEINLARGEVRAFKQPIEQVNAASALVREVDTK